MKTMCIVWTVAQVPVHIFLLVYFALFVDLTWTLGHVKGTEFTFILPAGRTECFYQTTLKDWTMEVEYQVIAGAGLDVGFTLISPSGYRMVSDFRRSNGIHTVDATQDGDYRLCFDNSYSMLSEKMVFFKVAVDGQGISGRGAEEWGGVEEDATDSLVDYKLEDIRTTLDSVYRRLETSRRVQTLLRTTEARDRYLLEDNLWRVSFGSALGLLVVVAVAAAQVYTLRRLFDDRARPCST